MNIPDPGNDNNVVVSFGGYHHLRLRHKGAAQCTLRRHIPIDMACIYRPSKTKFDHHWAEQANNVQGHVFLLLVNSLRKTTTGA